MSRCICMRGGAIEMFKVENYFYYLRNGGLLKYGRSGITPRSFVKTSIKIGEVGFEEYFCLGLKEEFNNIIDLARLDISLFLRGQYDVFRQFDRAKSNYCRKSKNLVLYPVFFRFKGENYFRVYYSPYEEFLYSLSSNSERVRIIIADFASEMEKIHSKIPNRFVVGG